MTQGTMRRSIYSLPDNKWIEIHYPDVIAAEELEDVLAWIDLVRRQISRCGIAVQPADIKF